MPPPASSVSSTVATTTRSSVAIEKASEAESGAKSRARWSWAVNEIIKGAQKQVYLAIEKSIWEVVLFSSPFINTQENSSDLRKYFRSQWIQLSIAPSLKLKEPAPFDGNVVQAVYTFSIARQPLLSP